MTIYYFDGGIIGRSSGRSSVGAAAYRAAEKLYSKSVGAAAYRSGDELRECDDGVIVHDYTRKKGVVHSEIVLPKDAPPEFVDRQTLWNAVEASERRKDAQLAREIVIALQREFDLKEQKEILREYIKENFTDKGMVTDFSIHDKKDGNPHAHILLTFREVTPKGFGLKNTDWNETKLFLEWRKSWADVNNRMFERKCLEERIDHRSYKSRGIDREPMVHLGHKDAALERKGVKTEKGNHNREVQKRNQERAAQKEAQPLKVEKSEQNVEELRQIAKEVKLEKELQKIREAQKTARYIENPIDPEVEPPFVSELERHLKAEKAMQHLEKMQEQQNNAEQIVKRMTALKENFIALEKEKTSLIELHNHVSLELPPLEYRAELLEEHAQNIETLQGKTAQLLESRQNVRLLEFKKKKEVDAKIEQARQELARAQDFFKNRFNADPTKALEEIKRLQTEIRAKKNELKTTHVRVQIIRDKQAVLELEYRIQKLLNEIHPDYERISQLLEQIDKPPESVRERQIRERAERHLETITDHYFEKAIEKLPAHQAQILTNIREQTKEREALLKFEREQDFLTRYYATQNKKERERLLREDNERRDRAFDRCR